MTEPEQAGLRSQLYNVLDKLLGEDTDEIVTQQRKQLRIATDNLAALFESTAKEVIGSDELELNREYDMGDMIKFGHQSELKAQQRQALSKLLGRGEEASDG